MEIYVVRHSPVLQAKGLCYGQTDVEVDEQFSSVVTQVHLQLPTRFDAVYASPLTRCVRLATALERGNVQLDERLKELYFGEWENQRWADLDRNQTERWTQDVITQAPPQGESMLDLLDRVRDWTSVLDFTTDQRILVVTHAGVMRCLLHTWKGIPLVETFETEIPYGHILHFTV